MPDDLDRAFSPERLIRTEITTLIGLLLRAPIDYSVPDRAAMSGYLHQTEQLLQELHEALAAKLLLNTDHEPRGNHPVTGEAIREPLFYGADSAYPFQYREFFARKYRQDADWLLESKGFDLEVAQQVAAALPTVLIEQIVSAVKGIADGPPPETTALPVFTVSYREIAARTGEPLGRVRAVIDAFAVPRGERNPTFESLTDFNSACAYPIIRQSSDEFILLHYYGFVEALYNSPFYWMQRDSEYSSVAGQHRGEFAEEISSALLARVFGHHRVFKNVELIGRGRATLGEIDVLVVFADCAIVLQAKTKRLTLEARKGNDLQLRSDFRLAIQGAVDQALSCAELLADPSVTLRSADGRSIPPIQRRGDRLSCGDRHGPLPGTYPSSAAILDCGTCWPHHISTGYRRIRSGRDHGNARVADHAAPLFEVAWEEERRTVR